MHFMASPATFFTRPMNEFTSPNAIECGTSTVALLDVDQRLDSRRNAMQQRPVFLEQRTVATCVHCGILRGIRRSNTGANIQSCAGKNCSGRRTMDLFVVVIIAAMFFTVATVFLGLLTMSAGGSTDKTLSTPLMWTRVGFQALTLLLLFAAMKLR